MSNELSQFGARVAGIVSAGSTQAIMAKAGAAGKKSALQAASRDLGGDRRFSGMRRKATLGAGFDVTGATRVDINFRPFGLWRLAEEGRRNEGAILPRRGHQAVMTPRGPRSRSSYKPSRGLNTYDDAERDAKRDVPKAAAEAFRAAVAKAMR